MLQTIMPKENLSMAEANKVTRVLTGKSLKYTCTVHFPDGTKLEFQAERAPGLTWDDKLRCRVVTCITEDHDSWEVCIAPEGTALTVETNPKP